MDHLRSKICTLVVIALWGTLVSSSAAQSTAGDISPAETHGSTTGEVKRAERIKPRPPAALAESDIAGQPADSVISPDDVLEIYVFDAPELSRQYRVSPGGTVMIPLLNELLPAAGMHVTEFTALLANRLRQAELITKPSITVSITSSRLKSVAITGAVKMPQIYPVFAKTTLLDILSQAQGLTDDAGNLAVITRGEFAPAAPNGERTVTVDIKKLMDTGDPQYNVDIFPGDRVTIPRAGIVYVVGAVNKPGGFPITGAGERMTLLQAVALAGDLKSTAIRNKAAVIRTDPSAPAGRRQIPMNLKHILAGKAEDPVLQANDILFVPDSEGAKALRRGLEAVIQTATGVAIYRR